MSISLNPFDSTDQKVSYSKVINRDNRSGETVLSNLIVKEIEKQYE